VRCSPSLSFPPLIAALLLIPGLLVDSEHVFTEVTNHILGEYGKTMTWDIKAQLMGKPDREAGTLLLSFFPDIPLTVDDYLTQRDIAQNLRWPTVPLLPGAAKLIHHLHAHRIPIAVASGGRRATYILKTSHLQHVFACFDSKAVCGDDTDAHGDSIPSKPAPDVFLIAARELLGRSVGTGDVGQCSDAERAERAKGLVFEDALPGMRAGKRAGMAVVWVPDHNLLNVQYDGTEKADQVISSLEHFVPEMWGLPPYDS